MGSSHSRYGHQVGLSMTTLNLVLSLEDRRRQALLATDLSALNGLLAEDLLYVHSTGVCDDKDSYLGKLSSGTLKYLELNFRDLHVQVLQQAAVVSGRMSAVVSKEGQRKSVASLFMTVWSYGADGTWRLHAHQGTPLPPA